MQTFQLTIQYLTRGTVIALLWGMFLDERRGSLRELAGQAGYSLLLWLLSSLLVSWMRAVEVLSHWTARSSARISGCQR